MQLLPQNQIYSNGSNVIEQLAVPRLKLNLDLGSK